MTIQTLRDILLAFMSSNPTAWNTRELAAKLELSAAAVGRELLQLSSEGKLVSCTVLTAGRPPEQEFRIAALEQKYSANEFVINKKTNIRLRTRRNGSW